MTKLMRVVYCSRSKIVGSQSDVEEQVSNLLKKAREANKVNCITGALTFNATFFAQVLEGNMSGVLETYERIRRDNKHHEVKIVVQTWPDNLLFANWSMAYVKIPQNDRQHPLADFPFESTLTSGGNAEADKLLRVLKILTIKPLYEQSAVPS